MEQPFCEGEHAWLEEPQFSFQDAGSVAIDRCRDCLAVMITQTILTEGLSVDLVSVVDNKTEVI